MTHTEAPFSVTFKTARGDLLTTRGSTIQEFRQNVKDVLLLKPDLDAGNYPATIPDVEGGFAQAEQIFREAGLVQSTVGQAPVRDNQNVQPPAGNVVPLNPPPDEGYPGDCKHGKRVYRDSIARGKPWRRWECNLEWRPNDQQWNSQRCKAASA